MSEQTTDERPVVSGGNAPDAGTGHGDETGTSVTVVDDTTRERAPQEPAPEAPAAGEPLFSATYDTTLELLTHYVSALVGRRQGAFSIGVACVDVVLAVAIAFAAPGAWPLAVLLLALGCGMLWYRKNGARLMARRILARLDPADAHRTVNAYPDRVELVRATGDACEYPLGDLTHVTSDDALVVMAFGHDGVTVPASGLTKGTLPELAHWASAQLASKASAAAGSGETGAAPGGPAK